MLWVTLLGVAQVQTAKPYYVCGPRQTPEDIVCATAPRATSRPGPGYTEDARRNGIQGKVLLWVVIGPDGVPGEIKVTRGLGHGLDEEAVSTVKRWRFDPGTVKGEPVPVQINVEVNFSLTTGSLTAQDAQEVFNNAYKGASSHDCGTAIDLAIRVTQVVPQHPAAWNLLGVCYLEMDNLAEAERTLKRQIEVTPQSAYAYNNLGRVYLRRREYDKAEAQFCKQLEVSPQDRDGPALLAAALRGQKRCKDAIPYYQRRAELTPDNPAAYIGLTDCYLELDMQKEAATARDKAAGLTSTGPGWNTLAWTLTRHKTQLDRAEQYAGVAISMDSAALMAVSIDPLTPGVYNSVGSLVAAWDTLGWILFLRRRQHFCGKVSAAGLVPVALC